MSGKRRIKTKLGELLLEKGAITQAQLEEALALQRTKFKGKFLGQVLSELGYCSEEDIYSALAMQLGYPYIKISNCVIDDGVLSLVPKEMAEKLNILPIDKIGSILTVAMLNPLEDGSLEAIAAKTGLKVKIFVTIPSELRRAMTENYGANRV